MYVLIPAYEPDGRLARLIADLLAADPDVSVLVVDDGSGTRFADVFADAARAGATVLTHATNRGKGAALKTGLHHLRALDEDCDVVTADADGQHTVADILRIVHELRADADARAETLILGCRRFSGPIPARSRIGNGISKVLFRVVAGWRLSDTQTGLRGIPHPLLEWVASQHGERFEFEHEVLLRSRAAGVAVREVPIETVYLDRNASSHFRPIADSFRVMLPLVLFAGSSVLAFLLDTGALLLLSALGVPLVGAILLARILSASVNFLVNRRVVFRARGSMRTHAVRYAVLAVALLASNIVWMEWLTGHGVPLLAAKIGTELVLFVTSYGVQRTVVFPRQFVTAPEPGHSRRIGGRGRVGDAPTPTNGRRP